jgi:hypothetical protein
MERHIGMTARRFAPIGALLVTACFPTITHGPRVENGVGYGLTAATTSGDTHVEGDEGVALRSGTFGAFVGQGWAAADPHKASAYLGLVVPVFVPYAQLDLYVQSPRAWTDPLDDAAALFRSECRPGGINRTSAHRPDLDAHILTIKM